jgi:fructokinase
MPAIDRLRGNIGIDGPWNLYTLLRSGANMARVFCLGEVLYDCIAEQVGVDKVEAVQSWQRYAGGAPANVACALTKLGTPSALVGAVGDDADGRALVDLLRASQVDVSGVEVIVGKPTRNVLVLRSSTGDRTFAGFRDGVSTAAFADAFLSEGFVRGLDWGEVDYLVMGTIALAYPESSVAAVTALQQARQAGVTVVVDVNWRSVFWEDGSYGKASVMALIEQADLLKVSDDEARWLFGTDDLGELSDRLLMDLPGLGGFLLSAGEKGCGYCLGDFQGWVEAFDVKVVDTTGAGDAFLAGVLHYLDHHGAIDSAESARAMVRYGCAVGAITTMRAGAIEAQPTSPQVEELLMAQAQAQANPD